jgi:D-alanyl-D-alanine carboxypeptidase (penicillin-binding protein 5/6)
VRRLLLALVGLAALLAPAATARTPAREPLLPVVDARAYLLVDGRTGAVLAERNADARLPIASITKLMTVRVALQHLDPSQDVRVTKGAAAVGESSIGLTAGQQISVRDLLEGALVQSANDAADALADAAGEGSRAEFVRAMNAEAQRLKLTSSHFVRPDGLDAPGHVSSARDVTRLARVDMHSPLVRSIVRMQTATIAGGQRLSTWNDLLSTFPGVFGVKTGHTDDAGWCEVVAARRDGVVLYATILGSPSRARRDADLTALLRYGFSFYGRAALVRPDTVYARVRTQYGRRPVELVATRPVSLVIRRDAPLVERIVTPRVVALPVRKGQVLGRIVIRSGARVLVSQPLVARTSVARPSLAGRVEWYTGRALGRLLP